MNNNVTDFFAKIRPVALVIEAETGIPWRFAATQSAHESRWGLSRLTVNENNLFGFTASEDWMKQGKPTGKYLTRESSAKPPGVIHYWSVPDDIMSKMQRPDGGTDLQVWRHFRKYDSWQDSLRDWAGLLAKPRYARALAGAKAGNFEEFAQGLQDGGYATDRDKVTGELAYARKLKDLWNEIDGIA